ncbi:PREDICTED: arginine kinase-like [Ceratosolen solmsi marchali]|uniref:arginine kinase n=1 Tax=Ceratosolen solmsi marchali TaxID=326594 RepID=A0AAJ7DYH2_9HYME|nr:PREDICTED: arginine kinase-like [Ceratosolen solmsi marchali]
MCDKSKCSCKKKGGQAAASVVQLLESEFTKYLEKPSNSLLRKYLTRDVFDKLKTRKTRFGSSLLDVIQSGMKNPDSNIGVYACDPEAYTIFAALFDPIIEEYHEGFKPMDIHPPANWGDPSVMPKLDPENKYIISTRIRCARSLENYPFNPTMTNEHYFEIQDKLSRALESLDGELKGKYYPLKDMDKETKQRLIDEHFLFKEGDRFLQDAHACEFWPNGRGIFYNDKKTLLAWCNEEDHLRLISMQMGGDLTAVYTRLINAICKMERQVKFSHDKRLGYLTFCPTNLGTTIRASVHIKLPKLAVDLPEFEKIAGTYNLQVRGTRGEHSESEGGVYDVSNKRRMGLTEHEAILEMGKGIAELIKKEESL